MGYWSWLLGRFKRQLWWQAVAYGLLGVFTAIVATLAERYVSYPLPFTISREAVDSLLNIIASSMLAVTTFSLGAMTSAFGAATSNVTPRATQLLMEDRVTHNVLSSFIGAFVFSIVGIIVLRTGSYGEYGRAALFLITIGVIILIVVQLLRWINHLISLGRVGHTIQQLEDTTRAALTLRQQEPYLGANRWDDTRDIPEEATPLHAGQIGYIQFIDMAALSKICDEGNLQVWLPHNSGSLVYQDTVLCWVCGPMKESQKKRLCDQFVIGASRTFEQDPRFGLAVLAEVGSRALSPATNDPGTALDILTRQTRLLSQWAEGREDEPAKYPRLNLHPISDADLFEDAFMLMARDGAHLVEIQLRLQKSLAALQRIGRPAFRAAARQQSKIALERSREGLTARHDLERLLQAIETSAVS